MPVGLSILHHFVVLLYILVGFAEILGAEETIDYNYSSHVSSGMPDCLMIEPSVFG